VGGAVGRGVDLTPPILKFPTGFTTGGWGPFDQRYQDIRKFLQDIRKGKRKVKDD